MSGSEAMPCHSPTGVSSEMRQRCSKPFRAPSQIGVYYWKCNPRGLNPSSWRPQSGPIWALTQEGSPGLRPSYQRPRQREGGAYCGCRVRCWDCMPQAEVSVAAWAQPPSQSDIEEGSRRSKACRLGPAWGEDHSGHVGADSPGDICSDPAEISCNIQPAVRLIPLDLAPLKAGPAWRTLAPARPPLAAGSPVSRLHPAP